MKLVSARLVIEPLAERDIPEFVAYRQRADVARYQSWDPDYSMEDALRLVAGQPPGLPEPGRWLQLAMHHGDRLVGDLAVHALDDQPDTYEVGVTVGEQRNGYALEGMTALVGHLFEVGAHRVIAVSDSRNVAVAELFDRIGFRHESRQVDADWFKGEWTTIDGWALLASDLGTADRG